MKYYREILNVKLKIIHLSDIHFKTDDNKHDIDSLSTAIASVVNMDIKKYSKILIIVTGDLTVSGKRSEMHLFNNFMHLLLNKCKAYVFVYVIPGNHDIEMNNELKEMTFEKINDVFNQGKQEELAKKYIDHMDNFFCFSNHLLKVDFFSNDKFVDCKKLKIDNYTIKIVLLNSAPFSTLSHDDKELHFIPKKSLNSFVRDENDDLVLVAMHHSYEWFHEDEKMLVENMIKNNAEVLLIGHEHDDRSIETSENGKKLIISKAGELNLSKSKGSFNVLIFDLDSTMYSVREYSLDDRSHYFVNKTDSVINKKYIKKSILQVKPEFLHHLTIDTTLAEGNIIDYFVFPILTLQSSDKNDKKIDTYEKFERELKKCKLMVIQSPNISGKTTFLKNIYYKVQQDGKLPLFIEPKASEKNMNTIIKKCIKEQYDGRHAIDLYKQNDKKEKVVLIDDFHLFKFDDKESILHELEKIFDYVIIAEKSNENINVKSSFNDEYVDNITIYKLGLPVYTKRHELVKRIGKKCGITDSSVILEITQRVDNAFANVEYVAGANIDFLVHYIHYLFTSENVLEQSYENNFNTVFEYEINQQIIKYAEKNKLDIYLDCLTKVAVYLHRNKMSKIKESNFHDILENYIDDYGLILNINEAKEALKRAKLLISEENNSIAFSNKSYLAFFVAKGIVEQLTNGNREPFENTLNNICFGINSDIIMFTIYLTNNKNIVREIEAHLAEDTKDYTMLSLSNLNIPYLSSVSEIDVKKLKPDKEKYAKTRNRSEELHVENTNLECKDIYDYDEKERSTPSNLLKSNFKYLKIYAQIIPTFYTKFNMKEKTAMIRKLRMYTSKVVYEFLHPLIDVHDDFVNETAQLLTEDGKYSYEENLRYITKALDIFTIGIILGIYDNISENSVNARLSIVYDNVFSNDPKKSEISNMIFDVMAAEKLNKEDNFRRLIHSYWTQQNNYLFKVMIMMIIINHLLERELNYKDVQKLVDMVNKDTGFTIYKYYLNNKAKKTFDNSTALEEGIIDY